MQYLPALSMSAFDPRTAQPGQWFTRRDGTRTQYVGVRQAGYAIVPSFSDAGRGDGFTGRTQRFARARWHLAHRHGDMVTLVSRAPGSVSDARLGALARASV
jgi:hypothetical protein